MTDARTEARFRRFRRTNTVVICVLLAVAASLMLPYGLYTGHSHSRLCVLPNGQMLPKGALYDLGAAYFLEEFPQYKVEPVSSDTTTVKVPVVIIHKGVRFRQSLFTARTVSRLVSVSVYVGELEVVIVKDEIEHIDFSSYRRAEALPVKQAGCKGEG